MLHCPECGQSYADGACCVCPADGAAPRAQVTRENAAPDELIGQTLDGKYRLDAFLCEGGMGTVYRATHLLIYRPVAVKVLRPRFVEDEAAQQRFRREARAAGRLRHPNAVAVTDFGDTHEGYVYIVMELLEGHSRRELLAAEGAMQAGRAVSLMEQAAAVAASHEAGVIHRDLKPGNVFVVPGEGARPTVKVLDFGIAKLAADSGEESDAKNLTQTGVMIGTPRYMSPEQCDGERLTPASDIYSLGVILYEMLTGAPPFNGPTPLAVALQHSAKPPRPPRELVPAIPAELEAVVLHALAKDPAARPADANVFRRELLAAAPALQLAARPDARDTQTHQAAGADAVGGNGVFTPSGGFGFGLATDHAAHAGNGGVARAGPNDTTIVADTASRALSAALAPASEPAPPGSAIERLFPLQERAFTRFRVLTQRRGWPQRLAQPPVLIALAQLLIIASVVAARLIKSRGGAAEAPVVADNANAAAAPSPTPEPTPKPAASERPRNRRTNRATANRKQQKRGGDNPVKKVLKKIFEPF